MQATNRKDGFLGKEGGRQASGRFEIGPFFFLEIFDCSESAECFIQRKTNHAIKGAIDDRKETTAEKTR